jgi:DNA-binding NarL/FixJ family response regulator
MAGKIVILEDNEGRTAAMRRCLRDHFPQLEARFFAEPVEMIDYLQSHLSETVAICLDHDLELIPGPDGKLIDPGTGRDVADYLARQTPACPVVIHTTNSTAGTGMEVVLREARWQTRRVSPFGDLEWIPAQWLRAVRRALAEPSR